MRYKGRDYNLWDTWYLNDAGVVHGFHLKLDGNDAVGHIVSTDLLHWKYCGDLLPKLDESQYPEDCLQKYTGCAFTNPADGVHYIYYTMRDRFTSEKIGLVRSTDLQNFERYEEPVLSPDPSICDVRARGEKTDCRDMLVIEDEQNKGLFYGYFASMILVKGRGRVGGIMVAESHDLIHWERQKPAFIPPFNGTVEVPDVFCIDGRWYLTCLTGWQYGAKAAINDPYVSCCTLYASADHPAGPYMMGDDRILLGGCQNSGFTCRSVLFNGKRYELYVDRSENGHTISLPKELAVINGNLRLCYSSLLDQLRISKQYCPQLSDFSFRKTSFAWETGVEALSQKDSSFILSPGKESLQYYMLDSYSFGAAEIGYVFSSHDGEGGLAFETFDENGNCVTSFLTADIKYGMVSFYKDTQLDPKCRRSIHITQDQKIEFRVIFQEGVLEVYVGQELLLQCGAPAGKKSTVGLFGGRGMCVFQDFHIYELES